MCLIAQSNIKPLVAQKDIKVIKLLKKYEDGRYVTPYQKFPVELNGMLTPADGNATIKLYGHDKCRTEIIDGYIHAALKFYIDTNIKDGTTAVEAYIPKGTEYYINVSLSEICAKKLYITDKLLESTEGFLSIDRMLDIIQPILDNIPTDELSPGWIYTSDNRFVHPNDIQPSNNAIGVVACTENGSVTIFSKNMYYSEWHDANKICVNYFMTDDDLGKWELPSKEVLKHAFANSLTQINAGLLMANGDIFDSYSITLYWASLEDGFDGAWCCHPDYASWSYNDKWYGNGCVRPCLIINNI